MRTLILLSNREIFTPSEPSERISQHLALRNTPTLVLYYEFLAAVEEVTNALRAPLVRARTRAYSTRFEFGE